MRKALRLLMPLLLVTSFLVGCAGPAATPQIVKETVVVKETVEVPVEAPGDQELITVLNPAGTPPPITLVPMAPRLDSLDGKTIYLVSVQFPLTRPFFEEMQSLLTERYPNTTWVFKEKAGTYFDDDPELWAEAKEKADGVVMGVGH